MNNKIIFSLLLMTLSFMKLDGGEVWLEGKAAYFHPTGGRFYDIYHDTGMYGGEITIPFGFGLAAWGSVDYLTRKGLSIGESDTTRIEMVPVGVGVKYFLPLSYIPIPCLDIYAGVGIDWSFVKTHDDSPYVIQKIRRNGWGAKVKGGAIIDLPEGLFLDIFVQYGWNKLFFKNQFTGQVYPTSAEISNISAGIGIGYSFCVGCF